MALSPFEYGQKIESEPRGRSLLLQLIVSVTAGQIPYKNVFIIFKKWFTWLG